MGFIASASVLLAGVVWGLRMLIAPGLFDEGSGALLAISLIVGSALASLGLVLVRGRWARRLAGLILATQLLLAAVMDLDGWGVAAVAATGAAVVAVAGPWLDGFLRQLPPADPPPLQSVLLAIGLMFVPGLLALSAPGGVTAIHWAAALTALVTGWAFARALLVGLWSARLIVPLLLLAAGAVSPLLGMLVVIVGAAAVTALAWSPQASLAVNPLISPAGGVAVPPELVPAELLARAGYDERGRPLKGKP